MSPRLFPLLFAAASACVLAVLVLYPSLRRADPPEVAPAPPKAGSNTVLLVALDGFRGDYLNAEDTPNLWSWRAEAAWSARLIPPFPSLTFPAHVTLATGRTVSGHGIPSNQFYDEASGEELRFPGDAALLRAEPIWTTATRQGRRVLSYDWPLSHSQGGAHPSDYFESAFQKELSDADRVSRTLELWANDPKRSEDGAPLRLITTYAKEADTIGHRHGPDATEARAAAREVDALLATTVERAKAIFDATAKQGDQLYLLFAADHGMDRVTHLVNIDLVLGEALKAKVVSPTSGPLANLHLREPNADDAEEVLRAIDLAFARVSGSRVYSPTTIPRAWSYVVEGRTGQRIVVLPRGHTFDRSAALPVHPLPEGRGPLGMHGYPPDEIAEMAGLFFAVRHPDPLDKSGYRKGDLGAIRSTQLHATLCKILGIDPAEGAETKTVWEGFAP